MKPVAPVTKYFITFPLNYKPAHQLSISEMTHLLVFLSSCPLVLLSSGLAAPQALYLSILFTNCFHRSSSTPGTNGRYNPTRSSRSSYLACSLSAMSSQLPMITNVPSISSVINCGISAHLPRAASEPSSSPTLPQPCRSRTGRYDGVEA